MVTTICRHSQNITGYSSQPAANSSGADSWYSLYNLTASARKSLHELQNHNEKYLTGKSSVQAMIKLALVPPPLSELHFPALPSRPGDTQVLGTLPRKHTVCPNDVLHSFYSTSTAENTAKEGGDPFKADEYAREVFLSGLARANLPVAEYNQLLHLAEKVWYTSIIIEVMQDQASDVVTGILERMEDGHLYTPEARERLYAVLGCIKKRVTRDSKAASGKLYQSTLEEKEISDTSVSDSQTLASSEEERLLFGRIDTQRQATERLILYVAICTYTDQILPTGNWITLRGEERAKAWAALMASARKKVGALSLRDRKDLYHKIRPNTYKKMSRTLWPVSPQDGKRNMNPNYETEMSTARWYDDMLLHQARNWAQYGDLRSIPRDDPTFGFVESITRPSQNQTAAPKEQRSIHSHEVARGRGISDADLRAEFVQYQEALLAKYGRRE